MANLSQPGRFCILLCVFCLLNISCNKRYWDWKKVRAGRYQGKTIKMMIENRSPDFLSAHFANSIKEICSRSLTKLGFLVVEKEHADYFFSVAIKVDTYTINATMRTTEYYDRSRTLVLLDNVIPAGPSHNVKELSFRYDLYLYPTMKLFWYDKSEFYFFGSEWRDIRRGRSMARYSLKDIP